MIQAVLDTVHRAGDRILEIYQSDDFKLEIKADLTPVTQADQDSNQIIFNQLKNFGYPVVSEEAWDVSRPVTEEQFWLVDPLDGTKDFIEKNDEFCVLIALIKFGKPVLGVIHVPAKKLTYYALSGEGVFSCQRYQKPTRLIREKTNKKIMLASRFHNDVAQAQSFYEKKAIEQVITVGSALKFIYLATGNATIYPRFSGSSEWDIAAGDILLKESGCQMIDLETRQSMKYNKPRFRNGCFIGFSEPFFLEDLS